MYPLALNIDQRLCVVVGGGRVAERKVWGILAAGGRVRLISPTATPGLIELADRQAIAWTCKPYTRADLDGACLVFAATNSAAVQRAVHRDARAAGLLVNVADAPELCDFQVPATIRRGDLTISVATGGKSPAVAAMVKQRLDRFLGEEYGWLTALAALLREQILAAEPDSERTRELFGQLLHDDIVDWLRDRQWDDLRLHVERVLGRPVAFDPESLTKEKP
ncbi:MAG: bifunctional precorrin-2 dehydrogenase/sirohydrochlorin ferrochelatase [Proteobacteria bacterium]|nr:bifunctional precorrin-2 dehydrogenase/sirohydrochlorin ferrochelatase [Pseudomonadota bacterium]